MVRGQSCLARMEARGMKLDDKMLTSCFSEIRSRQQELEQSIRATAKKAGMADLNIRSPQQRSTLLFELLDLPVYKCTNKRWISQSKWKPGWYKSKGWTPSTDKEALDMIFTATKNPIVEELLELQRLTAIMDGILQRCLDHHRSNDGFMRGNLSLTKLVTGQLSSTDPPMQNVPQSDIRRVFCSRFDGGSILEVDYSQLHLRIVGNLSMADGFIDAYLNGHDLHSRTAARVICGEEESVFLQRLADEDEEAVEARQTGKRTNFSIIFEIGARALASKTGVSEKEAGRIIKAFFEENPEIKRQIERQHSFAKRHGWVVSPMGRIRHLPDASNPDRWTQLRTLRQAGDYLISNSGRYITMYAMIMLDEAMVRLGMKSCVVMQVHDSIVLDVHPDEEDTVMHWVHLYCLTEITKLCPWMDPIPLEMDGSMGPNWYKGDATRHITATLAEWQWEGDTE